MDRVVGQQRRASAKMQFPLELEQVAAYFGNESRLTQDSFRNKCIAALRRQDQHTL